MISQEAGCFANFFALFSKLCGKFYHLNQSGVKCKAIFTQNLEILEGEIKRRKVLLVLWLFLSRVLKVHLSALYNRPEMKHLKDIFFSNMHQEDFSPGATGNKKGGRVVSPFGEPHRGSLEGSFGRLKTVARFKF